jgi:hypothetical protein
LVGQALITELLSDKLSVQEIEALHNVFNILVEQGVVRHAAM